MRRRGYSNGRRGRRASQFSRRPMRGRRRPYRGSRRVQSRRAGSSLRSGRVGFRL